MNPDTQKGEGGVRWIECVIKQRGRASPTDIYILSIMHDYTLDVDHSYPFVSPDIPCSTTPSTSTTPTPSCSPTF